ncbi:E3 ubiquitin-protein ligase RNF43 [Oenanthe melanoleuca]|uniref:E3 ubiquitin-protein ligase RNF43 n=1 Tax=Oenanthe melanoleuca TaxID=2939378 RepID=UPI0024C18CF8|nr:E3 ubiquitin-protein ligase RNF43 [Oenanthe melanoleuca]XP_056362511.1 E3 ubiquitin-protein ligase RNF43 [Oenanthe melanoleuca]XP_056362512.1 E3 ubiquitin-protein ligase RNF43 [Oenanthe melanoleuca]XP_056362513.1 E3 ubiquitin-protein ligase RNF43 [Oenanthe melanoleuca]XP_056362514.1 E3 ubiquitin-protein ligase RNF43 [Oenanthe melanoleuca]
MSAGPQVQLAVLWPWLLMATLQAGLGHTGLALAAAVESERAAAQKAIIRVIPLKVEPIILEGEFANVAEVTPAEGKLLQSHPLSLCNTSEDEHTESGFITIVKLEQPDRDPNPCLSLANKAKLAGERGARAILFDITDDESAADQLRKPRGLSQPVVLIRGHDAELLMGVVNKNREAHVKIEVKEPPAWPDYDVWILLTVVSTVVVIILIFVVRTKCQLNRTQDSVQQQTLQAIGQLATRRYQPRLRPAPRWDSASSCSSAPVCAICLEEFSEGQELRIISCSHEFHRECVDPWLQQHHTCPLCMFNILARDSGDQAMAASSRLVPQDMEPGRRLHLFRQHPGHALYHLPHAYPQRNLRSFPSEPAHGNPFFHSPELSQLDFGTIHYMPYRPATSLLACGHVAPLAPGLLGQQHPTPSACGQALAPHRTCPLQPQPPCLAPKAALAQKQHRAPTLRRGLGHGHQHNSSGSGESYLTEHSGYLADGPGSDSSSGPCHGSSSDSMLNCTDVSLQGIHGSCSTFRSSLSSDYDPFVYCSSEGPTTDHGQEQLRPPRERRPRSLDLMVPGGAAPAKPQVLSHVHYHHHQHHHYRRDAECPPGRASQGPGPRKSRYSGAKVAFHSARTQKRTEKSHHSQQPLESSGVLQEAAPVGQPTCPKEGREPPHSPSTSPDRLDFSVDANRQLGAAGTPPVPLPPRHSLQSRHHRRKRKCPLEPNPAVLAKDSAEPGACDAHLPPGRPAGYRCSPEAQPLIPSTPLPSGSRLLWKCLVPQSSSELRKQQEGLSGRERNLSVPADFSGMGAPRHSLSVRLHCPSQQGGQGSEDEVQDVHEHSV